MNSEFQYDVFLSHNQADKPRLRRLAERLRAAGLKPKAECGRQSAEFHPSTFFIHPSSSVGLERSTVGRGNLPFRDPANAGRHFIPALLLPPDNSLTELRKTGEWSHDGNSSPQ